MRTTTFVLLVGSLLSLPTSCAWAQAAELMQWRFESQRDEIAPQSWQDAQVRYGDAPTLALAGGGKAFADGRWTRTLPIEPETFYDFRVHFRSEHVEEPGRSVLARILWQGADGKQIEQTEYPATHSSGNEGWHLIQQAYKSPAQARYAKLELIYRWDADGTVHFSEVALEKVAPPAPRIVRLASVRYRPQPDRSDQENLDHFAGLIAQAAMRGADIVCLPEGITLAGTGKSYVEVSEPIPGPTTEYLGRVARAHHVYIVAGILERDGAAVYNTAVLLGRDGELVGTYRKVSLPREEYDGGVAPGNAFHTFDTDFGRIGIMICWDVTFPEAARRLAFDGAEVIFLPIWGGNTTLARARAIENQVYLVTSSYDMETAVIDQEGTLVAEASDEQPVIVVEVDLSMKKDWPWLGDFKNRIPREVPAQSALRPNFRE